MILTPKLLLCRGQETCYTLLPNQSSLAVFNDVHDVIMKGELVTGFTRAEHKQTIVVLA